MIPVHTKAALESTEGALKRLSSRLANVLPAEDFARLEKELQFSCKHISLNILLIESLKGRKKVNVKN